jgi:hypothetical protein
MACLLIGCTREQLEDRDFKEKEFGEEWKYYLCKGIYGGEKYVEIFEDILDAEEFCFHYSQASFKELIHTPRTILQLLGTEAGRKIIHPNIWVNALFADYEDNKSEWLLEINSKWIITDCRFPNEAQAVKDRGGIVIRVERDDFVNNYNTNERFKVRIHKNEHPSETALDDYDGFDYVIDNNGSIEDLIEKVKQLKLV